MSFKTRLKNAIQRQTEINKLKKLRDVGLDMILADSTITSTDFNESDKAEFVSIINERIIELGGTV